MLTRSACRLISVLLIFLLTGCTSHRAASTAQPAPPSIGPVAGSQTVSQLPEGIRPTTLARASAAKASLATCPGLPPVCSGGLVSQHATPDEVNAYIAKYEITFPLTCRFREPPRCYTGQVRTCQEQCTP